MLGRSLLHQGLVEQTSDGYAVLKLNALSWEVMRRQRSVPIAVTAVQTAAGALRDEGNRSGDAVSEIAILRKQLADEQGLAPYMVFADSTLKLMAQQRPPTLAEFSKISGVGSHKSAQYGRFVLRFRLTAKSRAAMQTNASTSIAAFPSDTQLLTLQLHRQGLSVEEIAQQRFS